MTKLGLEASPSMEREAGRGHPALAAAVFGPMRTPLLTGWWRVALLAGLIVAGALVSLARTPSRVWNVLWAEDGAIFISDALRAGPDVLFHGYAGYLHLVPRIAAEVSVVAPLGNLPLIVTILSAVITSLIACACFVFLETRVAALELRFAAWVACLALPIMGGEVANNLANLHWYLLVGAFCATAVQARSTAFAVLQGVIVFAAVTSDALALMLLPLLAFRWWVYTSRRDRVPSIAFAVGALLQIVVVVSQLLTGAGRAESRLRPSAAEFLDLYVFRVVLGTVFGTSTPSALLDAVGSILPGVVLALVMTVLGFGAKVDPSRRIGIISFAAASLVFSVVVFTLQWDGFSRAGLFEFFVGGRYAAVPSALLLLALIQAADSLLGRVRRVWLRRTVAVAVLLAILIPVGIDFRAANVRDGSAAWVDSLTQGMKDCEAGRDDAEEVVRVSTAPHWFGGMLMPCSAIAAWSADNP